MSILVELEVFYGYAKSDLPSSDSINRYLHQRGMIKPKVLKGKQPQDVSVFAKNCHDLWELDAQGAVAVQGLGYISMINIKDNKSKTYVMSFPILVKSSKSQPKTIHYLWALRLAFEEFGLPKAIQVDKDSVFIDNTSKSPFPSIFKMFLLGLNIQLCFITVSPPAKQAMVERSHQTLERQVLRGKTYKNWQELFTNTNKRRKLLNEKYPCRTLGKQAPLQAFPNAVHSSRHYTIKQENKLFDIALVEHYLAKCTWIRKVSSGKTISLKGIYYLKNAEPKSCIQIKFCAINKKLIFRDVNELLIHEQVVENFIHQLLKLPTPEELIDFKNQLFHNLDFPL